MKCMRILPHNNPPNDAPIVITRPQGRSNALESALLDQGRQVHCLPLVHIQALDNQDIRSCFMNLDDYRFVFPVSANAVDVAMPWVDSYWPQMPVGLRWLAVGPASKLALQNHDVASSDILMPNTEYCSEGLLELEELQATQRADKVLILRAKTGRSLLAEVLEKRGFKVQLLTLYERVEITHTEQDWQRALIKPAVIQLNSAESLDIALKQYPDLGQLALGALVPSKRIALKAESYFKQVWISRSACDADLLKCLT